MNGWTRALTTLLAAGVAGFLLWLAAQFDMRTSGGYWAWATSARWPASR